MRRSDAAVARVPVRRRRLTYAVRSSVRPRAPTARILVGAGTPPASRSRSNPSRNSRVERGHDCPLSLGANAGRVFEKAARASDPDARRLYMRTTAPATDPQAAEAGMKALESAPALENRAYLQSCLGRRVGDEIDDDLVADQWLAAPVLWYRSASAAPRTKIRVTLRPLRAPPSLPARLCELQVAMSPCASQKARSATSRGQTGFRRRQASR